MASPVRKHAGYEDLLRVPEDRIGEIVEGDLLELDLLPLWGDTRPPAEG